MEEDTSEEVLNFQSEIELFIDHIDSLYQTSPMVELILKVTQMTSEKKRESYLKEKGLVSKDAKGEEVTKLDFTHMNKYLDLEKKASNTILAQRIIQRNFVVSLVSQFDAFFGSLIRKLFLIRPELLNGSEKNLTFATLSEFTSVEEAKEFIIEKEIEGVLRDSHARQFAWMENKLGIPLTKDLPSWQNFIEITERRNLFVHANGVVSSQYLAVCRKHSVIIPEEVTNGTELNVNEAYFNNAYKCLYEMAVKLTQVVWRKVIPADIEHADFSMNDILYSLLQRKEYKLAINLSEFSTGVIKKHSSQEFRHVFNVNKAQAYKWNGQEEVCKKMLNNMDWSASSDKFKLSKAILLDDFESAYKYIKKIGSDDDELPKAGYQEWPLFNMIRKEDKFKDLYKEIFKEEYEHVIYDDGDLLKFGISEFKRNDEQAKSIKKKKTKPKKPSNKKKSLTTSDKTEPRKSATETN